MSEEREKVDADDIVNALERFIEVRFGILPRRTLPYTSERDTEDMARKRLEDVLAALLTPEEPR